MAKTAAAISCTTGSAEPGKRNQIDLFVLAHGKGRGDFLHHRIVAVVFQHRDHRVVGRVGAVVRISHDILGVEFARLGNDVTDLVRRDRQIQRVLDVFIHHGDPQQAEQAITGRLQQLGRIWPAPAKSLDAQERSSREREKSTLRDDCANKALESRRSRAITPA
jgi:hypothetical protein